VRRLLDEPTAENRQDASLKVACAYSAEEFNDDERKIAKGIIWVMRPDAGVRILRDKIGKWKPKILFLSLILYI
jgi:hypothetical protein